MSLGSIHIVSHRPKPASHTRLAVFWLGFATLLVLATLALAAPSLYVAAGAQQAAPGGPGNQGNGRGLFAIFDVVPTPESVTPNPGTTALPTAVVVTEVPVDTPLPVDTVIPPPTEEPARTPEPPATVGPTSTFGPTDTPIPPPPATTAVPTPATVEPPTPPPATITPIPDDPTKPPAPTSVLLTETPIPAVTVKTTQPTVEVTNTPVITATSINPNITPTEPVTEASPLPTVHFDVTVRPPTAEPPGETSIPEPAAPVVSTRIPITLTVTLPVSRTRLPTVTSTIIPGDPLTDTDSPTGTVPTPAFTATPDLDATSTAEATRALATQDAARATGTAAVNTAQDPKSPPDTVSTAMAAEATAAAAIDGANPIGIRSVITMPAQAFEQAVTATLAANSGAPILVYTYTQQTNADGEHIIAACIWNMGTVAATDVDVQFNARRPATFIAMRIPAEQSEFDSQQVKVRIARLNPKTLRQIEVGVMRVNVPLPKWVSVNIPGAYALDHPGDPAFPVDCTPAGIQAATSESRQVEIEVGGLFKTVNDRIEDERKQVVNPGVFSMTMREQGPAFSSFVLYCVIGLILALLLVVSLLAGERRKRVKPTRLGDIGGAKRTTQPR